MFKRCFLIFSFVFLSILTFGLTGGVIARVEDPGCYLYECDCFLYSEFSYSKELIINTRFVPMQYIAVFLQKHVITTQTTTL
ncbi:MULTISPECIES: hypothetical protein [unclassified Mesotoga]|jgi:hypothetical protein|uniref:hypothetical protein n=1 Tax=unclassified Mesotoga TaxID=1184398 RepID=UPI00217EB947|nr:MULTISPECIES: hypothetical protein [unclassified Mesotoga]MDD4207173.1 hypothetical protein [Mesotoga sp.]